MKCPEPKSVSYLVLVRMVKEDVLNSADKIARGVVNKPLEMIEELLNSNDPKLQELLDKLKNKIDLNENVSPE